VPSEIFSLLLPELEIKNKNGSSLEALPAIINLE
jgi:hypothetical protein